MIEKVIDTCTTITQGIKTALSDWYKECRTKYQQEQAETEYYLAQLSKQQLNAYIYNIMSAISLELFPVIQGHQFHQLAPINRPADIHIINYRIINDIPIYEFEIIKQTQNQIAVSILQYIKTTIQQDIYRYLHTLHNTYPHYAISQMHPFIYNGLYIHKIIDCGTAIRLYITSNYLP